MNLNEKFLPSFIAIVETFADQGYFTESAPFFCPDGRAFGCNHALLKRELVFQLGLAEWPITELSAYNNDQILDLVSAFYQIISCPVPEEKWFHEYCGNYHFNSFDSSAGRYQFTAQINEAFKRLGFGYSMSYGRIDRRNTKLVKLLTDEGISQNLPEPIAKLLTKSLEEYYSNAEFSKWSAVKTIADAFEYLKKLEGTTDVNKSLGVIIDGLNLDLRLHENLNGLFQILTNFDNDTNIRHHHPDQVEIDGNYEFLDFVYVMHYVLIKYASTSKAVNSAS